MEVGGASRKAGLEVRGIKRDDKGVNGRQQAGRKVRG